MVISVLSVHILSGYASSLKWFFLLRTFRLFYSTIHHIFVCISSTSIPLNNESLFMRFKQLLNIKSHVLVRYVSILSKYLFNQSISQIKCILAYKNNISIFILIVNIKIILTWYHVWTSKHFYFNDLYIKMICTE